MNNKLKIAKGVIIISIIAYCYINTQNTEDMTNCITKLEVLLK